MYLLGAMTFDLHFYYFLTQVLFYSVHLISFAGVHPIYEERGGGSKLGGIFGLFRPKNRRDEPSSPRTSSSACVRYHHVRVRGVT